jgi:hypothetical protein
MESKLTLERNVLLGQVHAESEASESTQITRPRRRSSTEIRVVDEQLVVLRQERRLALWRVLCVPENLSLGGGHVDGDGVGSLVGGARGEDIDSCRCHRERSVVPCKCDPVADLVELRSGKGVGGDHCEASGG